jgi:hypothetical protein
MTVQADEVNNAKAHGELAELYPQYEKALVENDVETLTRLFWASPLAMRFGATENLYGIDDIEAFRRARSAAGLARKITRLDIVTFGQDFGSVTLEFEREALSKTGARFGCVCQRGGGSLRLTFRCCRKASAGEDEARNFLFGQ